MYYPEFSNLPAIKDEDVRAGIVCSLYHWRSNKSRDFIENLLTNDRFRALIENVTGSSGKDWYRLLTRLPDDNEAADRALMETFNGTALAAGSHLERIQACFQCGTEMPGICYPRSTTARPKTMRLNFALLPDGVEVHDSLYKYIDFSHWHLSHERALVGPDCRLRSEPDRSSSPLQCKDKPTFSRTSYSTRSLWTKSPWQRMLSFFTPGEPRRR